MLRSVSFCILLALLPWLTPCAYAQSALHSATLDTFIQRASAEKTNILLVAEKGKLVLDTCFRGKKDELYRIYSITKIFSGIAVGLLYDQGLIRSADDRISDYFPEWQQDVSKKDIRIRHVLQHTSGLYSTKGSKDIYPQPDFVRFALQDSVITQPGTAFYYNNRAINLISGLVERRSGQNMEAYLKKYVFQPLGIEEYLWPRDKAGHNWGMDGLRMKADDLLKIGMMLADRGRWQGQQILSEKWLEMAYMPSMISLVRPSGAYGLALQVLFSGDGAFYIPEGSSAKLAAAGLEDSIARRLQTLEGKKYARGMLLKADLEAHFSVEDIEMISAVAFRLMIPPYQYGPSGKIIQHTGEIGQQLVILPDIQVAAVRFIDEKQGRKTDKSGNYRYGFGDMKNWMARMAQRARP
jgi:CubicO group peptidase (beta-lactamase class C family)